VVRFSEMTNLRFQVAMRDAHTMLLELLSYLTTKNSTNRVGHCSTDLKSQRRSVLFR